MTAQVAMWYPCQAFPGVKPLLGEGADATAVGMPMDHRRIGMGDTMLAMPRKDQTVNRLEVDGFLTLSRFRYLQTRLVMSHSPLVC